MQNGDATPWGPADDVTRLGDEVWWVSTPSHGGVRIQGAAAAAIPAAVGETFIQGPEWAEEDCEAVLVLSILEERGMLYDTPLGMDTATLRRHAQQMATEFDRYGPALPHLPAPATAGQMNANHQP